MGKLIDLTGRRFGRLVVMEREQHRKSKGIAWVCMCDCGKKTIVTSDKLKNGHTKSCGCLWLETIKQSNRKHGQTETKLYRVWRGIISRTCNPSSTNYANYGGRGITICEEWRKSFETFCEWAVQNGYAEGLSIDRIDNDMGYYPQNCRFITMKEQSKNTRRNRYLEFNGMRMTESDWADSLGIRRETLCFRLKSGWSIERALTTPVRPKKKNSKDTL